MTVFTDYSTRASVSIMKGSERQVSMYGDLVEGVRETGSGMLVVGCEAGERIWLESTNPISIDGSEYRNSMFSGFLLRTNN